MATNFPNALDSLVNPTETDSLASPSHLDQHININDAIEAIQEKIGVDNSVDSNSIDYRITQLESGGQVGTELGLAGNNDIVITGIENKTTIDSFSKSTYRTVRYVLQFSKNSEFVSEAIDLINDGTNINTNEYEIASNTDNNLANVTFEENSGIINLCVTPVSGSITVRYYRTALKS